MWYDITHSCPNFNDGLIIVKAWMNNYIPHDTVDVISYPYSNPDIGSANICFQKRPPSGDLGVIFVCILSRLTML